MNLEKEGRDIYIYIYIYKKKKSLLKLDGLDQKEIVT